MKRIRVGISIILVCVLVLISSIYAFSESEAEKYNLKVLDERLLEESTVVKKLNLDKQLLKLKYEEDLKQYNDLSTQADLIKESFKALEKGLEEATQRYQDSSDPAERQQLEIYKQSILSAYVTAYQNQANIFRQQLSMMQSMETLKLQQKQLPQKKDNEIAQEKYNLQKDYYDLYILDQQLNLLKQDLSNTKKSVDIEKIKEGLNMSNLITIESLQKQERTLILSVQQMENTRNMAIENIKTKINMPLEEELNIELTLPEETKVKEYSLSKLINQFKEKNLELEAVRNNTKVQQEIYDRSKLLYEEDNNKVKIAELELKQSQLDEISLERDLEAYVEQMYYQHIQVMNDLLHKQESQKLYEENERGLNLRYKQGMLSEVAFNLQKQDIQRNYLEVQQAIIAYENMKAQMELVERGIMVN